MTDPMTNDSARKAEPFKRPFGVGVKSVTDINGDLVAKCSCQEFAQWLRDRLNAALPQPTEDSRVAFEAHISRTMALTPQLMANILERVTDAPTAYYVDGRTQHDWTIWQAALSAAPLAAAPAVLTEAERDVLAERCRQIEVEGWTRLHDETEHDEGQLARAAACYATGDIHERTEPVHHDGLPSRLTQTLTLWPWDMSWWKPTSPRRNLVKAGALILAEIERLDRIDRLSTKGDAPTKEETDEPRLSAQP
jgi:hypothetical protein